MTSQDVQQEVLIVDDDADVRALARRRLERLGFVVYEAADGVDALIQMAERPSLKRMVTDYDMPRLGGPEWVRVLERFCADWRIVVVSGVIHDSGPFLSVPKPADYRNLATYLDSGVD